MDPVRLTGEAGGISFVRMVLPDGGQLLIFAALQATDHLYPTNPDTLLDSEIGGEVLPLQISSGLDGDVN